MVRINDEVRGRLAGGVATIVATRDDHLRPSVTRGWGISVAAEGTELTLCVGAPSGSRTRANLQSNGAIAVTSSRPTTYRTVQLKGQVVAIVEPTQEQLEAVEAHVEAFSREAEELGLAPGSGRRLVDPGLVAVSFSVHEVYDQTPGPNAGARI